MVVNEIFGFKWKKVKGELHNEVLHDLYFSRNSIGVMEYRMRWARSMIRVRKKRKARRNVVRKFEVMRQLGKNTIRGEDNVKMGLGIGWEETEWFNLARDRDNWRTVVSTVMNLRAPYNAGNFFHT
jgi:hypothetical protein